MRLELVCLQFGLSAPQRRHFDFDKTIAAGARVHEYNICYHTLFMDGLERLAL
jgi:hypothetical protein